MAMQAGPGDAGEDDPIIDINTTPLIDVLLVLLVMLIITIPIQLHAVNLDLPAARRAEPPPGLVRIGIDASGIVSWNGQMLAERADLERELQAASLQSPQPVIQVQPDPASRYEVLAHVLVSANQAGMTRIGVQATGGAGRP